MRMQVPNVEMHIIVEGIATILLVSNMVACQSRQQARATVIATSSSSSIPITRQLRPVVSISPAMTDLSPLRRAEILAIQSVLKVAYRNRLRYTFDTAGKFVVVLPDISNRKNQLFMPTLNSCHSPPDLGGRRCLHECSVIFEKQSWEAAAMSGDFGHCLDNQPIWLHPHSSVPNLLIYPATDT